MKARLLAVAPANRVAEECFAEAAARRGALA